MVAEEGHAAQNHNPYFLRITRSIFNNRSHLKVAPIIESVKLEGMI